MNLREELYFSVVNLRRQPLGKFYKRFLKEDRSGIPPETTQQLLVKMLSHCKESVPYYSRVMQKIDGSIVEDPLEYLGHMPILTKSLIRDHFAQLKSSDLKQRHWYYNTSGGSTGEPVRFIQDWEYAAQSGAIKHLYSKLIGREIGDLEIMLWGSIRDITGCTEAVSARCMNLLSNTMMLSVFRMTSAYMREIIQILNTRKPRLIVAYASALYELARFVEKEGITVAKQNAIISSAYTLHPFMRSLIESVFQCRVYDRYGSREVGDIACERPGYDGLWVAPWGTYVEVVDKSGSPVPAGERGEILVTSFKNYAMPLIRYKIGDMGVLAPESKNTNNWKGQFLQAIQGRSNDDFINKEGVLVDTGFFKILLYFRDWILQYQVVQKQPDQIVFFFVASEPGPKQAELDEIAEKSQKIMGTECEVKFEFVDEILPSPSGKYRYIISEIPH